MTNATHSLSIHTQVWLHDIDTDGLNAEFKKAVNECLPLYVIEHTFSNKNKPTYTVCFAPISLNDRASAGGYFFELFRNNGGATNIQSQAAMNRVAHSLILTDINDRNLMLYTHHE
ncbi:hypothetical protein LMH73_027035 [Vibrio splendidus]|nr:hypothetical protein [Vibrio splendidus]MCC4882953.1 hypothetical protein [Vibrio splendidus]